jgi:hypothetical protein
MGTQRGPLAVPLTGPWAGLLTGTLTAALGAGALSLHAIVKQQHGLSGCFLKSSPVGLSVLSGRWMVPNFPLRPHARQDGGARRARHAREVVCRPAGACGRVVVLKGTVYH